MAEDLLRTAEDNPTPRKRKPKRENTITMTPLRACSCSLLALIVLAVGGCVVMLLIGPYVGTWMGLPDTSWEGEPRPVVVPPQGLYLDTLSTTLAVDGGTVRATVEQHWWDNGDQPVAIPYYWPLPAEVDPASVTLTLDGAALPAEVLSAEDVYSAMTALTTETGQPAWLRLIGAPAVKAAVFPFDSTEQRVITLAYDYPLAAAPNGLTAVDHTLTSKHLTPLPVQNMAMTIQTTAEYPVGVVYSPTHDLTVTRPNEAAFTATWAMTDVLDAPDFQLVYGAAGPSGVSVDLLSYEGSADEDGFFLALINPPTAVSADVIVPRDLVIVLDHSGSMSGPKWTQAQAAAQAIVDRLNPGDRFNVIVFDETIDTFAAGLQLVAESGAAHNWLDVWAADGSTNINDALLTALRMNDGERPFVVLFLTDGMPTEGEQDINNILVNASEAARENVRFYTFGVGYDVNTVLLDELSQRTGGDSIYVLPEQPVDEAVASLYNAISTPVLTNVQLALDGLTISQVYPPLDELPDLYVGQPVTILGRYVKPAGAISASLTGLERAATRTYTFTDLPLAEPEDDRAEIARLWAARRVGDLLNTIRLEGENEALIADLIALSVRYGILTTYSADLLTGGDVFTQADMAQAAVQFQPTAVALSTQSSGQGAVSGAYQSGGLRSAGGLSQLGRVFSSVGSVGSYSYSSANGPAPTVIAPIPVSPVQTVGDRTFVRREDTWIDTTFDRDTMTSESIIFLSEDYFALLQAGQLEADRTLAATFALGPNVIFVRDDTAYAITAPPDEAEE